MLERRSPLGQLFPYKFTSDDRMVSNAVMTYWVNFAKHGDPNEGRVQTTPFTTITTSPNKFDSIGKWPKYNNVTKLHLHISPEPEFRSHYRAQKIALWRSFLPDLLKKQQKYECVTMPPSRSTAPCLSTNNGASVSKKKIVLEPTASVAEGDKKEGLSICFILLIALTVFFVCVSIVAFSLISYEKEKHRFQSERLRSELKMLRKRDRGGAAASDFAATKSSTRAASNGKSAIANSIACLCRNTMTLSGAGLNVVKSPPPPASVSATVDRSAAPSVTFRASDDRRRSATGDNSLVTQLLSPARRNGGVNAVADPTRACDATAYGGWRDVGRVSSTLRPQPISTEKFAQLEGIKCSTFGGRRRCSSALATTLMEQSDEATAARSHPAPPTFRPPTVTAGGKYRARPRSHCAGNDVGGARDYGQLGGSVHSLVLQSQPHAQPPRYRSQLIKTYEPAATRPLFAAPTPFAAANFGTAEKGSDGAQPSVTTKL